jgi:hypothetical protein
MVVERDSKRQARRLSLPTINFHYLNTPTDTLTETNFFLFLFNSFEFAVPAYSAKWSKLEGAPLPNT